jgi:hypothetical protein
MLGAVAGADGTVSPTDSDGNDHAQRESAAEETADRFARMLLLT